MDDSYVEEGAPGDEEAGVEGCYCFGAVEGGGEVGMWKGKSPGKTLRSSFSGLG